MSARLTAVLGDRELIQAELPPYEYPPPWIPIEQVVKMLENFVKQEVFACARHCIGLKCKTLSENCLPAFRERCIPDYDNDLRKFLPRAIQLRRARATDAVGKFDHTFKNSI